MIDLFFLSNFTASFFPFRHFGMFLFCLFRFFFANNTYSPCFFFFLPFCRFPLHFLFPSISLFSFPFRHRVSFFFTLFCRRVSLFLSISLPYHLFSLHFAVFLSISSSSSSSSPFCHYIHIFSLYFTTTLLHFATALPPFLSMMLPRCLFPLHHHGLLTSFYRIETWKPEHPPEIQRSMVSFISFCFYFII
jgi:hypothetical protein